MTSTDHELLLSINDRVIRIESEQARQAEQIAEIRTDITAIRQEQQIMKHDIESLQTSVYWVLAAIGIFLAAVAIIPQIRRDKPAPKPEVPAMPVPPLQPITIYTYPPEPSKKGLD